MPPFPSVEPPSSTEQDIEALDAVCQRLAGFDDRVSLEWLDGYMTALLAGPRRITIEEWLPGLLDDVFARTFSDPADQAQATAAITMRWAVLARQLDPQALVEDPDVLRLGPLMLELTDEDRQRLVDEGHVAEDEIAFLEQTGEVWAHGFIDATRAFPADWPEPDMDSDEGQQYDQGLMRIIVLTMGEEDDLPEVLEDLYPGESLSRDELIQEACYAAQDLRLYWLDHAPRPAPRRADPLPGRNDLCPCGSGKKFKKCHGQQLH
jgi:uncharacterized protein